MARDPLGKGILDKEKTRIFLKQVHKTIKNQGMRKTYDDSKFDELFDRFDVDMNGFIEKKEMAEFLKYIYFDHS